MTRPSFFSFWCDSSLRSPLPYLPRAARDGKRATAFASKHAQRGAQRLVCAVLHCRNHTRARGIHGTGPCCAALLSKLASIDRMCWGSSRSQCLFLGCV